MDNHEDTAGIRHLVENALPLIGRVGAIAGGMLSFLGAIRALTNETVIAAEGVLLVSAVVSSAFVLWSRRTRVVDEQRVTVPHYSRNNRIAAAFVLGISALLLTAYTVRVGTDALNHERENIAGAIRTPRGPNPSLFERTRTSVTPALGTATSTATSALATSTITPATFTAIPLSQITDVNALNKLGFDALALKNYRAAFSFFSRALQVDATNALAQLGYGETQFYLGNELPAQTALRTALQLNPALADAHAYLAFVYDQQQDYAKARAEYEEFLRVALKENPLIQPIRERVSQLAGRGAIPTAMIPNASPSFTPTVSPTFTVTPTPSVSATLTLTTTATSQPSNSPTRTATPK